MAGMGKKGERNRKKRGGRGGKKLRAPPPAGVRAASLPRARYVTIQRPPSLRCRSNRPDAAPWKAGGTQQRPPARWRAQGEQRRYLRLGAEPDLDTAFMGRSGGGTETSVSTPCGPALQRAARGLPAPFGGGASPGSVRGGASPASGDSPSPEGAPPRPAPLAGPWVLPVAPGTHAVRGDPAVCLGPHRWSGQRGGTGVASLGRSALLGAEPQPPGSLCRAGSPGPSPPPRPPRARSAIRPGPP